jgi:septum site-determining protein MinD
MLGQVLVVTSGKGGVGKTTSTANLGTALAAQGHKVLLMDADIGLRNLDVVLGLENRIVYDLVQVIEGTVPARKAMIRDKAFDNLQLIPAAQTRDKTAITADQMRDLCKMLQTDFDYILIDSPAGIEQGFKNAIAPASKAVVVTTPEVSAIRDADRVIGLIEAEGLPTPGLILNRVRSSMVRSGDMMATEDILSLLSVNLLGLVPEDEHIIVSTNRGVPAVHDPRSPAGEAFRRIAARLNGQDVPFLDLEPKDGMFTWIKRLVGIQGRVGANA